MIKVLIADDEIIVRAGIKSLINWEENGFRVVGLAVDGKEAMEMIHGEKPDIVLTDVMMPKMSGIDLIKAAKAEYPFIKFVVLSCHNDFEYVRRAMKYGAEDYVLKLSMDSDELLELLLALSKKIKEERKLKSAEFCLVDQDGLSERSKRIAYFVSLINGERRSLDVNDSKAVKLFYISAHKVLAFIKIDNFNNINEDRGKAESTLINVMEQQLKGKGLLEVFKYKENSFIVLLSFENEEYNRIDETVNNICQKLQVFINKYVNVTISIGISNVFKDYYDLDTAFKQADQACKYRFYNGAGTVCKYREGIFSDESVQVFLAKEQKELIDYLDTCDTNSINPFINNIIYELAKIRPPVEKCVQLFMEIYYCMGSVLKNYGDSIKSENGTGTPNYIQISKVEFITDAREILLQYGEYCANQIENARNAVYRKEIMAATDYIKKNYSSNISLKSVAQHVFVSDSYLSRIFKENLNMSFVEYLTGIRIEKAIEFIKTTNLPNYAIAEKIGYENINYFGRVFKKTTGLTPTQYRSKYNSFDTGKNSE